MSEKPDPRYVLANERTLLAWLRTSLALMAGGFAVSELLAPTSALPLRRLLGLPLILTGVAAAVAGYRRWRAADAAIRDGGVLPATRAPLGMTIAIVVVGLVALIFGVLAPLL